MGQQKGGQGTGKEAEGKAATARRETGRVVGKKTVVKEILWKPNETSFTVKVRSATPDTGDVKA